MAEGVQAGAMVLRRPRSDCARGIHAVVEGAALTRSLLCMSSPSMLLAPRWQEGRGESAHLALPTEDWPQGPRTHVAKDSGKHVRGICYPIYFGQGT